MNNNNNTNAADKMAALIQALALANAAARNAKPVDEHEKGETMPAKQAAQAEARAQAAQGILPHAAALGYSVSGARFAKKADVFGRRKLTVDYLTPLTHAQRVVRFRELKKQRQAAKAAAEAKATVPVATLDPIASALAALAKAA